MNGPGQAGFQFNQWSKEGYMGLLLCCCVNWKIHSRTNFFDDRKLQRFIRCITTDAYELNEKKIKELAGYVQRDFNQVLSENISLVPIEARINAFFQCAYIIASSEYDTDLKLIKVIQEKMEINKETAQSITHAALLQSQIEAQLLM